ncbi:MAG: DUF4388 domain-containing protein [Verrucomicrobiota bacterium]
MPISKKVVTFTCHQYRLAVDSNFVARLGTATKKTKYITRNGLSVGLYDIGGAEQKVVELFDESEVGTTSSVIIIRTGKGEDTLAIRACQIENFGSESNSQAVPVYEDEISPIFRKAFTSSGLIYFLLDPKAIETICPDAINREEDKSTNEQTASEKLPIKLNSKHWLPYSLSILSAQKRSGQLQLIARSSEATISFTSGYPTYAAYEVDFGLTALLNIASSQDWVSYKWHPMETDASPNISEPLEHILREVRDGKTLCKK